MYPPRVKSNMTSILNPTGIGILDYLYYVLVLGFGPCAFWYLIVFRPRRVSLLDNYIHTGVSCVGIITHRNVTVVKRAGNNEGTRIYWFRYAYKAPGFDDVVYIKDFVPDPTQVCLQRRCLTIVALPGDPRSGVPEFMLHTNKPMGNIQLAFMALLSLALTAFSIYLFGVLYAVLLFNNCKHYICYINWESFAFSAVTIFALGLLGAYIKYRLEFNIIPGKVWMRLNVLSTTSTTTRSSSASCSEYYSDLNRQIPVADVVAVLEQQQEEENQENQLVVAAAVPEVQQHVFKKDSEELQTATVIRDIESENSEIIAPPEARMLT